MFYLDKETKDMKLAHPAGLSECVEEVCPEERESKWADQSLAHVRNNLVGFRQLLSGTGVDGESRGVEELLRGMGATELADNMSARIDDAIAAVDAVDATMAEALTNNPQSVVDVYEAVKDLTDLFKSQFFDVLDLEVPQRGEGDND
jgi:predicted lipoprotein